MHVEGVPGGGRRAREGEGGSQPPVDPDARLAAMLDLDARIRSMRDPDEVVAATSELMGTTLGVIRVGYGAMDPTGEFVSVTRDWAAPGHASARGVHDMRRFGTFLPEMADGRLVVVRDTGDDPRTDGAVFAAFGTGAMVNIPFVEEERLVAFLFVNAPRPRDWTECDLSFLRLLAGRLHDAVERRRAEAALRAQAARFQDRAAAAAGERDRLWNATRDLMGSCDAEGTILDVNPAWCRAVGWPPERVRGTHYLGTIHPDDHVATAAEADRVRSGGRSDAFVNRLVARDGSALTVSWNAVCENGITHFSGRDITGQLATEEVVRQSQKMEAVGQLTGGLAHDFNNILSGLQGAIRLTRKAMAEGRHDRCGQYLDLAAESVDRGTAIVRRLLAFSRRQVLDPAPTDLGAAVEGIVGLVRATVGSAVVVSTDVEAGLWTALVDPSQVDNAILNLCINARDAMPGGGSVRIVARNVTMDDAATTDGLARGHYVALGVVDDGPGMDPVTVSRAFDPFFTTKPAGIGTGLGLSMVHGFARQSGGAARIDTGPGRGTAVTMYLPRHG